MASTNSLVISGRLGAKPTAETTHQGKRYARFSVAVDDNYKINGEWTNNTNWFDVRVYGESGARSMERLNKGDYVVIEGSHKNYINEETKVTKWYVMCTRWFKTPDQRKSHQGQDFNQAQINDDWASQDQQIQRVTNTSYPYVDQRPAPQSAWDKGAENTWPEQKHDQWASPQPRAKDGNIIP